MDTRNLSTKNRSFVIRAACGSLVMGIYWGLFSYFYGTPAGRSTVLGTYATLAAFCGWGSYRLIVGKNNGLMLLSTSSLSLLSENRHHQQPGFLVILFPAVFMGLFTGLMCRVYEGFEKQKIKHDPRSHLLTDDKASGPLHDHPLSDRVVDAPLSS